MYCAKIGLPSPSQVFISFSSAVDIAPSKTNTLAACIMPSNSVGKNNKCLMLATVWKNSKFHIQFYENEKCK